MQVAHLSDGTSVLSRWAGSGWAKVRQVPGSYDSSFGVWSFTVNRSDLQGGGVFDFALISFGRGEWDRTADYTFVTNVTNLIEVKRSWIKPDPPKAGSTVVVGAEFANKSAQWGKVTCRGKLGLRDLPGTAARLLETGTCTFRLPANAAGKMFKGEVTLKVRSSGAASELSRTVAGTLLELIAAGSNTATPIAGQRFDAAFKVVLKRLGAIDDAPRKAKVDCSATLGGRPLAGTGRYILTFETAQCVWNIPSSARGSTLAGRIVVQTPQGLTASQRFSYPVR